MAFVTALFRMNAMRGSLARAAAELANAAAVSSLSRILTSGGAARGTTVAKAKTVNTVTFTVGGTFYSLAATDDFWTLSGTVVAAASFQKYLLMVDTSGTMSIQEGVQAATAAGVTWTNVSGLSKYAPYFVALGSTKVVVAVLTVATDATHTFTPGSTALNGAGITATFINGLDQSILPLIADDIGNIVGNGG